MKDRAIVFENLQGIDLDPTSPRTSRLTKVVMVALATASIALFLFWLSRVDVFPAAVKVVNDAGGSVVCYQRFNNSGHDYVQDAGHIAAGQQGNVQVKSSCSVFDTSGRYVACLIVPSDGKAESLKASAADRSVSVETCVYPR